MIWYYIIVRWLMYGCNPRLSQVRELATPFEEWGHPSYYLIIWEVSPLYDLKIYDYDMIWSVSGLVVDYYPFSFSFILILWLIPWTILHLFDLCFCYSVLFSITVCYRYICSLSSRSSAAFLFMLQVLVVSWEWVESTLDLEDLIAILD